jgi:hypothetical protein
MCKKEKGSREINSAILILFTTLYNTLLMESIFIYNKHLKTS